MCLSPVLSKKQSKCTPKTCLFSLDILFIEMKIQSKTTELQESLRRGLQGRDGQLRAYAAAERLQRALGSISLAYTDCLQPTAEELGSKLQIPREACSTFAEEVCCDTIPTGNAHDDGVVDDDARFVRPTFMSN